MEEKILEMPLIFGSTDGACIEKNLQEIYYYYGYPITTSKMLGIANILECIYYEGKNSSPKERNFVVRQAAHSNIDELNCLPFHLLIEQYKSEKEGLEHIIEFIDWNIPINVFVNTYYLHYTKDYLKVPGGYLGSGHALLIYGYDKKNQCFIVADPTFDQKGQRISFAELSLAWQYKEGMKEFMPFHILYLKPTKREFDLTKILRKALIRNLHKYFQTNTKELSQLTWKDVKGLREVILKFQECIQSNCFEEKNYTFLKNVAFSIFHEIRWSRYTYGMFLNSAEFDDLEDIKKYRTFFCSLYKMWTNKFNQLELGLEGKSIKRIQKSYDRIIELVNLEIQFIKEMPENDLLGIQIHNDPKIKPFIRNLGIGKIANPDRDGAFIHNFQAL